jgi:hypothetical protein
MAPIAPPLDTPLTKAAPHPWLIIPWCHASRALYKEKGLYDLTKY